MHISSASNIWLACAGLKRDHEIKSEVSMGSNEFGILDEDQSLVLILPELREIGFLERNNLQNLSSFSITSSMLNSMSKCIFK